MQALTKELPEEYQYRVNYIMGKIYLECSRLPKKCAKFISDTENGQLSYLEKSEEYFTHIIHNYEQNGKKLVQNRFHTDAKVKLAKIYIKKSHIKSGECENVSR